MNKDLVNIINQDGNVRKICNTISNENGKVRFVGGCVRDLLIGKKYSDVDIISNLTPEKIESILKKNNIKTKNHAAEFGTIFAILDGKSYEITSLREDVECDGRHAKVKYTQDWELDAARRDFTINAMSLDLDGNLYDYFGGYEDLLSKRVRFVGDPSERIIEDHLRILRYFRFCSHYNLGEFNLEAVIACKINAKLSSKVSHERIEAEFVKLLQGDHYLKTIEQMHNIGILKEFLSYNNFKYEDIKNSSYLEYLTTPELRLTCILRKLESLDPASLFKWLQNNKYKKYVMNNLQNKFSSAKLSSKEELIDIVVEYGEACAFEQILLQAFDNHKEHQYTDILMLISDWSKRNLPVSGYDLMEIGIKSGKDLGNMLKLLKRMWLNSNCQTSKLELLRSAKNVKNNI